ncbi:MAG TPA: hypothetical protein VHX42_05395 [Candidatus Babeliales bacterium]|nr:hypothetical protein [Candidatus Babeliales bacterium]
MKRIFIIFGCTSFCYLFSAEHSIVQPIEPYEQYQRSHTAHMGSFMVITMAQIAQMQNFIFEIALRPQEPLLLDRMREVIAQFEWEEEMNHRTENHRARRGDKHRKPIFMQPRQYYRNNNRVDHPTYAQRNKYTYKSL